MRKKRRACQRFRTTFKLYCPLRPAWPGRQEPETPSLPTFLNYSALNLSSSSSSSVKSSENPSIKNVALALAKACFSEASTQRGHSENYSILSLSLTWLTAAPHSVSTGVTELKSWYFRQEIDVPLKTYNKNAMGRASREAGASRPASQPSSQGQHSSQHASQASFRTRFLPTFLARFLSTTLAVSTRLLDRQSKKCQNVTTCKM